MAALLRRQCFSRCKSLRSSAFFCTLPDEAPSALEIDDDPAFGVTTQENAPAAPFEQDDDETDSDDDSRLHKWKKLVGPAAGIYHGHISRGALSIMKTLKERGHGAYLVGGCLRDTLLKQIPKDYDVLTTAELRDVKKAFARSLIVGRAFPVCHVNTFGGLIEVSSFSTIGLGKGRFIKSMKQSAQETMTKDDLLRWQNAMRRDFTINGFLYDPSEQTLYDYVGGLADLEKRKVRTIIPAHESFREDPARLLRGIRIAARLGFRFSRDTSQALKAYRSFLPAINQARLMQELNTMMAHGSAAQSVRLLWKYGYLEAMLPLQADYFERVKMKKSSRPRKNLLTDVLTVLDKFITPDNPCPQTLWIAVLALHLAVEGRRSHLGVTAAVLAMRHQSMNCAIGSLHKFEAMLKDGITTVNYSYFERSLSVDENTVVAEALQIIDEAMRWLTRMHGQPEDLPRANGTLISRMMYAKVQKLFQGARDRVRHDSVFPKRASTEFLRRQALKEGADAEVVYVLSCIFLNVLYLDTQRNVFLFR